MYNFIAVAVDVVFKQVLYLYSNDISYIDEDAFTNTSALEKLNLGQNQLTSLPPILDLADTLQYLDVTYNAIQIIPDAYFNSCFKMETLRIGSNKLTVINRNKLAGLESIRDLYFENNKIGDIAGDFIWDHPTLSSLYLSDNILTQIPSLDTKETSKLNTLFLAGNKISYITEDQTRYIQHLSSLDMSRNLITEIDFIFALQNIREIRLGNNPFPFNENSLDNITGLTYVSLDDSGLD